MQQNLTFVFQFVPPLIDPSLICRPIQEYGVSFICTKTSIKKLENTMKNQKCKFSTSTFADIIHFGVIYKIIDHGCFCADYLVNFEKGSFECERVFGWVHQRTYISWSFLFKDSILLDLRKVSDVRQLERALFNVDVFALVCRIK